MVRSLLVLSLLALLLSFVSAMTLNIFAPATMTAFFVGLALLGIGAALPTRRPLEAVLPPSGRDESPPCPVCRRPLRWVPEFGRWWCKTERKYR